MQEPAVTRLSLEKKKYCPKCYAQYGNEVEKCPGDGALLYGCDNNPLIGKVLADRYDIQSVLGLGGMSIVYKARHRLMDRTVAIKMLHTCLKEDVTALERFRLEAQASSSLSHQNIITVHDFGVTDEGEPYFVMDCLEGETLKDLIDRKSRVPYERAVPLFKQICDGLEAAHKKGIIHRDLKPANVVLLKEDDGSETVKLVDFGIAKILPQSGKQVQQLTQAGEIFGSPIYMSPEQCTGKDLDIRSDIYALGCLMYETLAGSPPLLGDTFVETMHKHIGESPKPLREAVPEAKIPRELDEVVLSCLAKHPGDRFQTAGEVRDHLSAISVSLLATSGRRVSNTAFGTTPLARTAKHARSAFQRIMLSSAAVIVAFGVFFAFWQGPPEDHGPSYTKLAWMLAMFGAERAEGFGNNALCDDMLKWAQVRAEMLGDGKARLLASLRARTELYGKWEGHAQQLEEINTEINQVQAEQTVSEYTKQMAKLKKLNERTTSDVARMNNQLNAEAQIPSFLATAAKLSGRNMLLEASDLLEHLLTTECALIGKDTAPIADIETAYADTLITRRKFDQVRGHLVHAEEIRKQNKDIDFPGYVRAVAKLGQYDLDQNDMTKATPELENALKLSRSLKEHKELRVLCLRSYASLLEQCSGGKSNEIAGYRKEADKIEKTMVE